MQNKESMLSNAVGQAFSSGDLERMTALEKELFETQNTLSQLRLLSEINHAAASTNSTPAEVVASGVDSLAHNVQGPSAEAIVNGYDISAYATDPLHEQKIQNLISSMPAFNSIGDIDAYIQFAAPGSPVTGQMVQNAASLYTVDLLLMLAIMQNDSNFGTIGIGARTYNPGNVGNNGIEERNYPSWEEGVSAVANWLFHHRYVPTETLVAPPPEPVVEEPQPKKKKAKKEEPEPETEPEPLIIPELEEEATTTPPVLENTASTTPSSGGEDPSTTASSTDPSL